MVKEHRENRYKNKKEVGGRNSTVDVSLPPILRQGFESQT